MARRRVDLYCEDEGHESFVRPLLARLASECGVGIHIDTKASRGGHGRALTEFRAWQKAVANIGEGVPDVLVLVIDGNCTGWNERRSSLESEVDRSVFPSFAIGCPDPHVERWCFADPIAFQRIVGSAPPVDPNKCERGEYKRLLREAIEGAGQPILASEMEFAPDIVAEMDLYEAGQRQRSLGHFVDSLRSSLRQLTTLEGR